MPSTLENQSSAKHSTAILTLTERNTVELSKLFTPEFLEFTEQLSNICNWTYKYRETVPYSNDNIQKQLLYLEGALGDAVNAISEIMAIEFLENIYYKN